LVLRRWRSSFWREKKVTFLILPNISNEMQNKTDNLFQRRDHLEYFEWDFLWLILYSVVLWDRRITTQQHEADPLREMEKFLAIKRKHDTSEVSTTQPSTTLPLSHKINETRHSNSTVR
jgi:hypothetical protein